MAGTTQTAHAAPAAGMTEAKASKLFEDGRYAEAIAGFEQMYDNGGSPNFLYNVARIYEEDGKLEDALVYYEKFVRSRGANLDQRKLASERATAIREILGPRAEPEAEPEAQEPSAGEDSPTEHEPKPGPSKLAIAGYSLLGVGGATLIVGGVMGGLALRDHNQLTGSDPVADSMNVQSSGQRKALIADVLFGVGGAFALTGITLVVVDAIRKKRGSDARAHRNWQLGPGPTFVGLGLHVRI